MPNDLLISDLARALPREALTDVDATVFGPAAPEPSSAAGGGLRGAWRVIDYKSPTYNGRMLQTTRPDAPPLRVPLNRSGWHAISIGLSERSWGIAGVEVRLTGDERWQPLFAFDGPMHEEPWRFADLTGRDLEIRYPSDWAAVPAPGQELRSARICSIRATSMAPEHVERLLAQRPRPLVYTNDGFGIFFRATSPGAHIVGDSLARFAGSDFDTCCFCHGGADVVNYPSRVGTRVGEGGWDFPRAGDANVKRLLDATLAMGIDPLRQAIDQAHAQGQKFWLYIRPQAWMADPDLDHLFRSRFFAAHPELRCVEADGAGANQLSIAYEPVCRQLNAVMAEALERGADGLTIAFVRGFPMVRYERPVCERFAQKHGGDARERPESDPALQAVWAEFVTAWLEEVRAMLDAAGPSARAGRRELSVIVGPDAAWNARFGFDVPAWAKRGLVDVVMPYPKGCEKEGRVEVAEYAAALRGTSVKLLPGLGSWADHRMTLAAVRRRAHAHFQQGADGLHRWDAHGCLARVGLNNPEEQRLWCEHYLGEQEIELTEVAGVNLKAYGPRLAL